MRGWKGWAVAAVLLFASAVPAWAQTAQTVDGASTTSKIFNRIGGKSGTSDYVLKVNSDGSVNVVPAASFVTLAGGIDDTITVASGLNALTNPAGMKFQAESTSVYPTAAYRAMALAVRVIPAGGDTATVITLAVQVRGHTTPLADSASTFPWMRWAASGAVAGSDSLGSFTLPTGAGFGAYSDEFLLHFSPKTYGGTPTTGRIFGTTAAAIPLYGFHGERFAFPYISVRIRVLTGASKPRVTASLVAGS